MDALVHVALGGTDRSDHTHSRQSGGRAVPPSSTPCTARSENQVKTGTRHGRPAGQATINASASYPTPTPLPPPLVLPQPSMRSICPALNSPRPHPVPSPRRISQAENCLLALPAPSAATFSLGAIADLIETSQTTQETKQARKSEREGRMVFFCFLVDQRRKVRSSKPAAGICSRCGGCASVADMETATRVCYLLTVHRRTWRAIICTFCGAMLKSYRHYRLY
ncbi:hypothetical protein HU200_051605 [Digitaria exilis]|uniref:Uncharacterized protein n=2 Tax=Panicoideae TaxID=147369 RepID=A0A835E831_9POAL|nr:hypothetical protein HU200_051605 [Digitaria exilis]